MNYRLVGGALMLLCVLLFQPGADTQLQRLWLPLLMALGAALILQNLLAVLATSALLALLRMAPGSADWISAYAYPIIGCGCALATLWILARRYRRYMISTRQERAARRHRADQAVADKPPSE